MSAYNQSQKMLAVVANALGKELLKEVAFVGGCTTGLLLTDKVAREAVRYTDDVDLIVHVIGYTGWLKFQKKIKNRGFKESMEDDVNCRMRLDSLIVDFMPDDEKVLGYSNRWYTQALKTAIDYELHGSLVIRLVSPVFFIATKLEAYKGRGKSDLLQSRDIEDILNVFDGRAEIVADINQSPVEVRTSVVYELTQLLKISEFEYAVQSTAQGQRDREDLIFSRFEAVIGAN